MTKFINLSKEESKKTVFTDYLDPKDGWYPTESKSNEFKKVVYLGNCKSDGDMFVCYFEEYINIYKGVVGDEF